MRLKHIFGLDTLRGLLRFYTLSLVSLPIILAAVFFAFFQRGKVIDLAMGQLAASLRQEGYVVDSWVAERFDDTRYLARLEVVRRGDLNAMADIFGSYAQTHPFIAAVVYANAAGYTSLDTSHSPSVYVGDRPYFTEARAGRQTLVSGLLSRASGQPICLFAAPVIRADGTFGGLVFMPISLDVLDKWLRQATGQNGDGDILSDGEGRILAPSTALAVGGGLEMARVDPRLLAAGDAGRLYTNAAGQEVIGASVTLEQGGWRLSREVPVSTVLAGYRQQSYLVGLGALATIIVAMPLALWLCRGLERPLEQLSRYARALREKNYGASCPLQPSQAMPQEVAELFEAFATMACEVRAHIEETERLSVQDMLTGLYNRRFLFSGGLKLLGAAMRSGQPCACLMLDVDHFKRINDAYGHQAGDQVLAHLGRLLTDSVRKSDLAARYGGEEFALLLVGAGLAQGLELAERIRRGMAEQPCPAAGRTLAVTVSVGVAELLPRANFGESDLEELLARADAALYAAKAAGRNKVMADAGGAPPA
ncbi:diguanylate cyclase [Solidesulfovibrio sp.]